MLPLISVSARKKEEVRWQRYMQQGESWGLMLSSFVRAPCCAAHLHYAAQQPLGSHAMCRRALVLAKFTCWLGKATERSACPCQAERSQTPLAIYQSATPQLLSTDHHGYEIIPGGLSHSMVLRDRNTRSAVLSWWQRGSDRYVYIYMQWKKPQNR